MILAIVVANAALGTYQEYQAEQALEALSSMQVPQVRVRRDGEVQQISAEELVPGDIVLLNEGDRVPADGRLIVSANLQIEEAALTGESQAVYKNTQPIDARKRPARRPPQRRLHGHVGDLRARRDGRHRDRA